MKYAVIYYSKSGVTKKIAEQIQERFSADVYFVEPEKEYGSYASAVIRVGKEMLTKKAPVLKTEIADFSQYDIVFVGFPVWYGTLPQFLQEYLSKADLSGKLVIPFATAGANGKESSLDTLKKLLPDSKVTGFYYVSKSSKPNIEKWFEKIETIKK